MVHDENAVHLSIVCPACQQLNRLETVHDVDMEDVSCSQCGKPLGKVGDRRRPEELSFASEVYLASGEKRDPAAKR